MDEATRSKLCFRKFTGVQANDGFSGGVTSAGTSKVVVVSLS